MSNQPPVNVVLCWHMHQPQYEDQISHEFYLPWTYLHAIKDYIDMAVVLEENPLARAVVNFTPVLLEQIDQYVQQCHDYFHNGVPFKEPLLKALGSRVLSPDERQRLITLRQCLRANEERLINRFPAYRKLAELARSCLAEPHRVNYVNDQFLHDIAVWYHLAWLGETVRQHHKDVRYLIDKGRHYSFSDRLLLLQIIQETLIQIIPKYRQLVERGQVELSVTPNKHPILPLLIDFNSARDAQPELTLPEERYPGGIERAQQHLAEGRAIFKSHFGFEPQGCWPSEGALCTASLRLIEAAGFRWTASGGGVLRHTLDRLHKEHTCIHQAFQVTGNTLRCFFRDDPLSDLIGFTFANWLPQDAVNHMVHHILQIREHCGYQPQTIVPIILDGENCWEYYPENGYRFLSQLYKTLSEHPDIHLTTFSQYSDHHNQPAELDTLVAGSWVYGNLSTWIGDPDKNRGWQLLVDAKKDYDKAHASLQANPDQARKVDHQLAICEGSDWFWWFGDYNPAETVADFDYLYRNHLQNLYRLMGLPIPEPLRHTISVGKGAPENSGVMRRGHEH